MTTKSISIVDLFDNIFEDMDRNFGYVHSQLYPVSFPPCDVYIQEETKDMILEFAVAGIPKDQINLSIEGDYLIFKIEKTDRHKDGYKCIQKGIKSSSATQKFYVPSAKYQSDKVKVDLIDGILSIYIPAKEELKPRKLLIE